MTDRTARITRISSAAGYVVAAAGVLGLASIWLSQLPGNPGGAASDIALLVMIGALAPLMLAFYELGGRTPLRMAQLAQTLGWVSVGTFVVVQLLVIAGTVTIDRDTAATGVVAVASLALGYIGLWIAGANLLAGPWLKTGRWLGIASGLLAVVFAFGVLRGGTDSGWTWIGGIGLLALGAPPGPSLWLVCWAAAIVRVMASWAEFERAAPAIATGGHAALFRGGASEAFLTTVPGAGLPRMHVVNVGIVAGRLLVFVQAHSAKAKDLTTDGRYALHAFQDPAVPDEFLLRGRAVPIADGELRAQAVAGWPFSPADDYPLFELDIAHAILGERPTADDWPPKYASWRPES